MMRVLSPGMRFSRRTSVCWVEAIPWYEDGLVVGLFWLGLWRKGEVNLPVLVLERELVRQV